jgi:hypothetical protein
VPANQGVFNQTAVQQETTIKTASTGNILSGRPFSTLTGSTDYFFLLP